MPTRKRQRQNTGHPNHPAQTELLVHGPDQDVLRGHLQSGILLAKAGSTINTSAWVEIPEGERIAPISLCTRLNIQAHQTAKGEGRLRGDGFAYIDGSGLYSVVLQD